MIVRDEMMNPAGGIERFVHATLPHVEQAVILDTGSIDGTWQKLQELQELYPHLRALQHPFEGYGPSRNRSLAQVNTRRALVLDADEAIRESDWGTLRQLLLSTSDEGEYAFTFRDVYSDAGEQDGRIYHNPRLFDVGGRKYEGKVWELLTYLSGRHAPDGEPTGITIYHFKNTLHAEKEKRQKWYKPAIATPPPN